jgi:putative spermidine/putrescine transport system permease protein
MELLDWPSGSALSFALTAMAIGVIWLSSRLTKSWAGTA